MEFEQLVDLHFWLGSYNRIKQERSWEMIKKIEPDIDAFVERLDQDVHPVNVEYDKKTGEIEVYFTFDKLVRFNILYDNTDVFKNMIEDVISKRVSNLKTNHLRGFTMHFRKDTKDVRISLRYTKIVFTQDQYLAFLEKFQRFVREQEH